MSAASRHHSKKAQWVIFTWRVALALFVLRALVPLGFMPDFSAKGQARISLAFCTPGGAKSRLVDLAETPEKDPSGKLGAHSGSGECSFAVSASPALPATQIIVFTKEYSIAISVAKASPVVASASLRGPPLGSRAPPVLLS
jgi:hypothetical protein